MKVEEEKLRKLVKTSRKCKVFRDGGLFDIESQYLVVGDVLLLDNSDVHSQIIGDLVVISGECICDESSHTGDATPTIKTPLPISAKFGENFNSEKHKSHTIYGGSSILQVNPKPSQYINSNTLKIKDIFENYVVTVVVATGFESAKGELFRSIMYPNPIRFNFYQDAAKFMLIMTIVVILAFFNRVVQSLGSGTDIWSIIDNSLDLLTVIVPPALPLILNIGVAISMNRLKKQKINCLDPQRIESAGRINIMCWDKTGTLTSSTLQYLGSDEFKEGRFSGLSETSNQGNLLENIQACCHGIKILNNEIVGHTLDVELFRASKWTIKQEKINVELHESSFPVVVTAAKPLDQPSIIYTLRRFDFDSHLQRNSVIVYENDLMVYTKGSPESIRHICNPKSIPSTYNSTYLNYTSRGYYVLACAFRKDLYAKGGCFTSFPTPETLNAARRDQVERDLTFAGFLIFKNPLNPEAKAIISILKEAKIKSVIISGDNAMTTIHTARELEMIQKPFLIDCDKNGNVFYKELSEEKSLKDLTKISADDNSCILKASMDDMSFRPKRSTIGSSMSVNDLTDVENRRLEDLIRSMTEEGCDADLAVTGAALDALSQSYEDSLIEWVIARTKIYARAKPHHKTLIIEKLIRQDNCVGMCGDGTNDSGALKAAHVGIALSNAETCIISPFTSGRLSIQDVLLLLAEGRCELETSFTSLKYMTLYPVMQLILIATLHQFGTALSNDQFLFDDLFLVLLLSVYMSFTGPQEKLIADRPPEDIFNPLILSSIVGQILINVIFLAICVISTINQSWYCDATTALTIGMINGTIPSQPDFMDLIDNFFLTIANDTETTETNYLNSTCYPINPATDMLNNQLLVSSHENTSFWLFAHFQFISVALAFCVAVNYRKPFWTNILFTFHIVLVLAAGTAMVIAGDTHPAFPILKYLFGIREGVSDGFRTSLGVLAGMNLVACILWEVLVVEVFVRIWLKRRQELFDLVQKKMGSVLDGKITKMLGRGALVQYFSTVVVAARETGGRVAGEFSEWTNRRGGWGTSVTSFWGKSEAKSDEVPLVDKIPEDIENGQSELNEITRCANFG